MSASRTRTMSVHQALAELAEQGKTAVRVQLTPLGQFRAITVVVPVPDLDWDDPEARAEAIASAMNNGDAIEAMTDLLKDDPWPRSTDNRASRRRRRR